MLKVDESGLRTSAAPSAYVRKIEVIEAPTFPTRQNNSVDKTRVVTSDTGDDRVPMGSEQLSGLSTPSSLRVSLDIAIVDVQNSKTKKYTWTENDRARKSIFVKVIQVSNSELKAHLLSEDGQRFFNQGDPQVFKKYNNFIDYQIQTFSMGTLSREDIKSKSIIEKNTSSGNSVISFIVCQSSLKVWRILECVKLEKLHQVPLTWHIVRFLLKRSFGTMSLLSRRLDSSTLPGRPTQDRFIIMIRRAGWREPFILKCLTKLCPWKRHLIQN